MDKSTFIIIIILQRCLLGNVYRAEQFQMDGAMSEEKHETKNLDGWKAESEISSSSKNKSLVLFDVDNNGCTSHWICHPEHDASSSSHPARGSRFSSLAKISLIISFVREEKKRVKTMREWIILLAAAAAEFYWSTGSFQIHLCVSTVEGKQSITFAFPSTLLLCNCHRMNLVYSWHFLIAQL